MKVERGWIICNPDGQWEGEIVYSVRESAEEAKGQGQTVESAFLVQGQPEGVGKRAAALLERLSLEMADGECEYLIELALTAERALALASGNPSDRHHIADWKHATDSQTPEDAAAYIAQIKSERNDRQTALDATKCKVVNLRNALAERDAMGSEIKKAVDEAGDYLNHAALVQEVEAAYREGYSDAVDLAPGDFSKETQGWQASDARKRLEGDG